MMVVQGDSSENFKIILHKRSGVIENKIQILKDSINISLIDNGIEALEKIVDKQFLNTLIQSKLNVGFGIDLLSKKDIQQIAEDELNKISENILINGESLNLISLTKYFNEEYGLEIRTLPHGNNYLGSCDVENNIICINKSIQGTPRHLFVLCHEFGHYILHQNLTINQITYDSFSDSEINFATGKHSLINPRHWIEWQANCFAVSFLLPGPSVVARLYYYQNLKNLKKDPIYFNDTIGNRKMVYDLVDRLANYFSVSKTTIIYRLTELNHFKDNSRVKSVGQLINEYKKNYYI
jgi:Zn-dependent peptidase ImmA (M78 family)